MRLECVVICVDYEDYLQETLPITLEHVDDAVVVTRPEDKRTIGLCHKLGVRCLPTRCFYQNGETFNKARGINYGLMHLRQNDWVLQLDADIILPSRTKWHLENSQLETHKLYGCDRVNVKGRAVWDKMKAEGLNQYWHSCAIHPPVAPLASRIVHYAHGGYCPIGFFQLWNPKGSNVNRYPDVCEGVATAERTDLLHALQWAKEDRVLLPELFVLHLETSGHHKKGKNWWGRKSPRFTIDEPNYYVPPMQKNSSSKGNEGGYC